MRDRARTGCAVIEWTLACQCYQVAQRVYRQFGRGDHDDRLRCHARDRLQVALDNQTRFRIHQAVDDHRVRVDEDGITVGRFRRDLLAGDAAGSATMIHHHHRLAENARHLVGEHARDRVDTAAGRKAHNDAHCARWKGIILRGRRSESPNIAQAKAISIVLAFNNVECDCRSSARRLNCELLLRLNMAVFPPRWLHVLALFFRCVVW